MRPIIGITAVVDDELVTSVNRKYIEAVERSGGTPILLPYVDEDKTIEGFVNICDGFVFTGGADIDPRRYGEKAKATCGKNQAHRDEFEFNVFEKLINTSKPILAICRGAQLVNVALGGTLYQDIPSEIHTQISHSQGEPKFSPSHEVRVVANTPLHEIMEAERIKANSFHHQAIKTLGEGLEIMALSDDEIVEAVYLTGERYLRAYQWHPERLYGTDSFNRKIFDDFIENCRVAKPNNA